MTSPEVEAQRLFDEHKGVRVDFVPDGYTAIPIRDLSKASHVDGIREDDRMAAIMKALRLKGPLELTESHILVLPKKYEPTFDVFIDPDESTGKKIVAKIILYNLPFGVPVSEDHPL